MIAGKPTKWTVFNHTDGIPATSESFDTFMDAKSWIESWRTNLNKQQGFYLTSDLRRIPVDDVAMKIHEVDKLPDTKPILTEPIHDAYGDGVSPDTFSDIIDKLDTTTLHNDIEIMVVCESTGKKYKALADVIRSDDGTLCISGIKHDDEAIAQECMEKLMEMLQFKANVDGDGSFAEYWTAKHGLEDYIEEFGVWCALRKYFADYIAEARKFKRRGCSLSCVRATWGEKCEGKCEWPVGEEDDCTESRKLKEILGKDVRGMVYDYVGDGWEIDLDHGRMGFLHNDDVPRDGVKIGEELMFHVHSYTPAKLQLNLTYKGRKDKEDE